MNIQLSPIPISQKPILKAMLLTYLNEIKSPTEKTIQDYLYLDSYWQDTNRIPLFILVKNQIAGFALLNDFVLDQNWKAQQAIAEFYIRPAFRRIGIGQKAAHQIFNTYPGKWEIKQELHNLSAQAFWRSTISAYTHNNFQEKKQTTPPNDSALLHLFKS